MYSILGTAYLNSNIDIVTVIMSVFYLFVRTSFLCILTTGRCIGELPESTQYQHKVCLLFPLQQTQVGPFVPPKTQVGPFVPPKTQGEHPLVPKL